MDRTRAVVLGATHLVAIAVGVGYGLSTPSGRGTPGDEPLTKTDRGAVQATRRVSAGDLLAAYTEVDSPHYREALERRQESDLWKKSAPAELVPERGEGEAKLTPEERAAMVTEFGAVMAEGLERVELGKGYDWMFYKALVRRWMEESPEACMAWIGRMEMRTGWGDPFSALFDGTVGADPERALKMLEDGWLPGNRRRALESLAERVGRDGVAELPAVLEQLTDSAERERFLKIAIRSAEAEFLPQWIEVIDPGDWELFRTLAQKLIKAPGTGWVVQRGEVIVPSHRQLGDWEGAGEAIMAIATGTPAEAEFRKRWDRVRQESEKGRLLATLSLDPSGAFEDLIGLRVEAGEDPAAARKAVVREITSNNLHRVVSWEGGSFETGLRQVVLGRSGMDSVLAERIATIQRDLPVEFHEASRQRAIQTALSVDAAAVGNFALQEGLKEELREGLTQNFDPGRYTIQSTEMLRGVMGTRAWEEISEVRTMASQFSVGLVDNDWAEGVDWLRSVSRSDQREVLVEAVRASYLGKGQPEKAEKLQREVLGN